jgi:hypothetical protein
MLTLVYIAQRRALVGAQLMMVGSAWLGAGRLLAKEWPVGRLDVQAEVEQAVVPAQRATNAQTCRTQHTTLARRRRLVPMENGIPGRLALLMANRRGDALPADVRRKLHAVFEREPVLRHVYRHLPRPPPPPSLTALLRVLTP